MLEAGVDAARRCPAGPAPGSRTSLNVDVGEQPTEVVAGQWPDSQRRPVARHQELRHAGIRAGGHQEHVRQVGRLDRRSSARSAPSPGRRGRAVVDAAARLPQVAWPRRPPRRPAAIRRPARAGTGAAAPACRTAAARRRRPTLAAAGPARAAGPSPRPMMTRSSSGCSVPMPPNSSGTSMAASPAGGLPPVVAGKRRRISAARARSADSGTACSRNLRTVSCRNRCSSDRSTSTGTSHPAAPGGPAGRLAGWKVNSVHSGVTSS